MCKRPYQLTLFGIVLSLAGLVFLLVQMGVATAVSSQNSARIQDPVVVSGTELVYFDGVSIDQLALYAWRDDSWEIIENNSLILSSLIMKKVCQLNYEKNSY